MKSENVAINSHNIKNGMQYKVIPQVLDENQSLFLNLSQHGLQISSDI